MRVLIPNLGSTSLKYRLLRFPGEQQLAAGRMERIGRPGGDAASYSKAIGAVLREVGEVHAVGFKAVHAGPSYRGTFRIDDGLLAALEEYAPAAPLHNGIYLDGIREFRALCPGLPLVAVMETGFHSTVPDHASTYGLPEEWRRKHGIRRYGFHGASHRSIGKRVPALLRAEESGLRDDIVPSGREFVDLRDPERAVRATSRWDSRRRRASRTLPATESWIPSRCCS